jgi:hypothetical protein
MEQSTAPAGRRTRKSALFGGEKPTPKAQSVAPESVEAVVEESRPAMRPDMREESPLARAAKRAAEIKNSGGLTFDGVDEFYIDPSIIPEGWSYEWKRESIYGQKDDTYQLSLRQSGWEPVPYSRHRGKFAEGTGNTIERKGMLLMERPAVITDEMRRKDNLNARAAVEARKQNVDSSKGMLGREDSRVAPKISKGYEPMLPPT